MVRGAAPLQASSQLFEHFLAPGNSGDKGGGCLYCTFEVRANKRFVLGEENTRGQGGKRIALGKKSIPRVF